MKLSVIIVNYNVKHFLEQCLHAVQKAIGSIDAEVFVVDNNSVDGSNGMVVQKFPWVKLIANKQNLGFSKANNQAIRVSTGEYVLLLNPDTVVEEKTFEKVLAFMDGHPEAGGLGVKMIDGRGHYLPESKRGLPTPWVAFYKMFGISSIFSRSKKFGRYHLSFLDPDQVHEIEVLAGAFMLMRRETLDKVGLLDEEYFMYGEDIDLSYRITQGGYKNFYYPGTTIIHYKGESTRKGSLNYVRMFYNAMIIFARKHFTKQYAGLFSLLIHLAIYFRAIIASISRVSKQLWLPALDFIILFLGFKILLPYWENYRYDPDYYPDELLEYAIPVYIISWILALYYSGGYQKPVSIFRILKGLAWGTLFILVAYSLLPENLRFSRAIILLGAALSMILIFFIRLTLHFVNPKQYNLGSTRAKKVAIVGFEPECTRVRDMLKQTDANIELIGYVSHEADSDNKLYIGSLSQIDEIIRINQINELIFCSEDIPSAVVIKTMLRLTPFKLEYKIAPPKSVSIIGSNSIDTAGDLYIVNTNAISEEKNQRQKRLLDLITSIMLLVGLPISIWFIDKKFGFIINILKVISGRKSWVGFQQVNTEIFLTLPVIKPGILSCAALSQVSGSNLPQFDRLNLRYARDYRPAFDVEIIWKNFKNLGDKQHA